MDLDHEDPRSQWRVDWICSRCGFQGMVILSGDHIRCQNFGEYTTVSPLICCVCGKNTDIYPKYIFCTYTGKSDPNYVAIMQDLVDQGVVERVPPIEHTSSEEELLDFEKAIKQSQIERAPLIGALLDWEKPTKRWT